MKSVTVFFAMMLALVFAGCTTAAPERISSREKLELFPLPYRQFVIGEELPGDFVLVILLHGSGERGSDNSLQLTHGFAELSSYCLDNNIKAVLLFPQCPEGQWWNAKEADSPLVKVEELLDRKREEFQANRVYATGLSMGGFGVWEMAQRNPAQLTAIIPICGGGDPAQAEKLTELPILAVHGSADNVVQPKRSRDMVRAIWDAGGDKVIYQELPLCGHNSWRPAFESPNTWKWLFAQ